MGLAQCYILYTQNWWRLPRMGVARNHPSHGWPICVLKPMATWGAPLIQTPRRDSVIKNPRDISKAQKCQAMIFGFLSRSIIFNWVHTHIYTYLSIYLSLLAQCLISAPIVAALGGQFIPIRGYFHQEISTEFSCDHLPPPPFLNICLSSHSCALDPYVGIGVGFGLLVFGSWKNPA